MKKSAFLLLALTLPFAACQSNDTPDEPTKSVAPEAAESMAMATFEFKRANPWGGCISRARGALSAFEGLEIVDMKPGQREFSVKYNKKNANTTAMAAALEKVGEAATIK